MKIVYVQPDGTERSVEVPAGTSVMRGALDNGIDGIVAECGGSCMCATCHVYVDDGDVEGFAALSDDEDDMLEVAVAPRQSCSRLSCQLVSSRDDVRLRVIVPSEQV